MSDVFLLLSSVVQFTLQLQNSDSSIFLTPDTTWRGEGDNWEVKVDTKGFSTVGIRLVHTGEISNQLYIDRGVEVTFSFKSKMKILLRVF